MSPPERPSRVPDAPPAPAVPSHAAPDACDPHGRCITCADEGVPMRVLRVPEEGLATCEAEDGARREVLTGLVADVAPGDVLLVHAGTALLRLEAP